MAAGIRICAGKLCLLSRLSVKTLPLDDLNARVTEIVLEIDVAALLSLPGATVAMLMP